MLSRVIISGHLSAITGVTRLFIWSESRCAATLPSIPPGKKKFEESFEEYCPTAVCVCRSFRGRFCRRYRHQSHFRFHGWIACSFRRFSHLRQSNHRDAHLSRQRGRLSRHHGQDRYLTRSRLRKAHRCSQGMGLDRRFNFSVSLFQRQRGDE